MTPHKTGYWVELKGLQFSDDVTWIQALPLGTYQHPLWGEINVTPSRVKSFASNVENRVREIDLDIDYDHKANNGKAAGWIRQAEARDDGLWVAVEWTEPARAAIANNEYRYFSPEFQDEWTHPKTGAAYQDVLFGGALTNRPYLKDIMPINMSDIIGGESVEEFLAMLREKLGLVEDATAEDIMELLSNTDFQIVDETEVEAVEEVEEGEEEGRPELELVMASELETEQLKTLAEDNPAVKLLMERQISQDAEIRKLKTAHKLSEANVKLGEWSRGGDKGKFALPAASAGTVTKILTELPSNLQKAFHEFVDNLLDSGLVELGERGKVSPNLNGNTAAQEFSNKVAGLIENAGMSYADAAIKVSSDDPELFDAYSVEVASGDLELEVK